MELRLLSDAWADGLRGHASAVLFTGGPGSGKTALIQAFAASVAVTTAEARVVALGPAPATSGRLALAALALEGLLGLAAVGADDLAVRIASLTGSRGDALAYEVALLQRLLGRQPGAAGGNALEEARTLATDLVLRAVAGPTLLIADEIHRSDAASWDWVADLVLRARERCSPILLLGAAPLGRTAEIARLADACAAAKVEVGPLDQESAKALLGSIAGSRGRGSPLARALLLGRGHPATLAAFGRALRRGEIPAGDWHECLRREVEALGGAARALVDALAVAGGPLPLDLLAAVAGSAEARDALAGAPMLGEVPSGVWFEQSAWAELIPGLLAPERRTELHRRLGTALEADFPRHSALHFERAGDRQGLVTALTRAAGAAHGRFDLEEARALLKRALDASERECPPPELINALAEVQISLGRYDEALGLLARHTVRLAGMERARAYRLMGRALERKGEYAAAKAHLVEGLAETDLPPSVRGGLLADLAVILVRQGDYSEARRHAERAVAAGGTENTGEIALAYSVQGICHYRQGRFQPSRKAHRKALALRERAGDPSGMANSLNNLGAVQYEAGHWDAALASFGRALALPEGAVDSRTRTALHNNLAALQLARGDLDSAEDACRESLAAKTRTGEFPGLGIALATMASVHALRGRLADALGDVEEAIALLEGLGEREILADVHASRGEILLRQGETRGGWTAQESREASAALRRGLDLAEESGKAAVVARIYRLSSELHRREGRLAESRTFALEAVARNRLIGRPLELARSLRQLVLAGGDPDGEAAGESARLFEKLGIAPEPEPCAP